MTERPVDSQVPATTFEARGLPERLRPLGELPARRPETVDQLGALLAEADGVLWPIGGGWHTPTSPPPTATLLDMRGLDRILGWDRESCVVAAQAGVSFGALEAYVVERGASLCGWRREHPEATIGGLLSAAQPVGHALWNGSAREACVALSALDGQGRGYDALPAPRRSAGPDLRHLFIGAEGRFGVITAASVGVSRAPVERSLARIEGVAPEVALKLLADVAAAGLRAPNVIYSGEAREIQWWLEGESTGFMKAAIVSEIEALGLRVSLEPVEQGPPESWGFIRSGADPISGRGQDARGAVSIWGPTRALSTLPERCWKQAVVYDISAHQASVWLPAGSSAASLKGRRGARVGWWGQEEVEAAHAPSGEVVLAGLGAIKAAMDPRGILPPVDGMGGAA